MLEMSEFLNICNEKRKTEVSKRRSEKIETEKENQELVARSYRTIAIILRDSNFWENVYMISPSKLYLELTRKGIKLFEEAVGNIKPVVNLDRQWIIELAGCKLYNLTSRGICIEANDLEASIDDIIHKILIDCCEKGGTNLVTLDQHLLMDLWDW